MGRKLAEIFNSAPRIHGVDPSRKTIGTCGVGLLLGSAYRQRRVSSFFQQLFGEVRWIRTLPFKTWAECVFPLSLLIALERLCSPSPKPICRVRLALRCIYTIYRMDFHDTFGWTRTGSRGPVQWSDMGAFNSQDENVLLIKSGTCAALVALAVNGSPAGIATQSRLVHLYGQSRCFSGRGCACFRDCKRRSYGLILHFGGQAGREGDATRGCRQEYWRANVGPGRL